MSQLKSFHRFLKLPFEIRVQIWEMAFGPRMVRLTEDGDEEDDEYDEDNEEWKIIESIHETLAQQTKRQAREKELSLYDVIVENYRDTGWRKKQTQLESFGFTSIHAPPKLRRVSPEAFDDETREGRLFTYAKIPALLVTCRESREVLRSLGYDLTFASRTRSAKTWFNYRLDFLELGFTYVGIPDEGRISRTIDLGSWNIGQILPRDRRRVRRLALKWHPLDVYALIQGIRMFGALEEVLLVWKDLRDSDPGFTTKDPDDKWDDEDQDFEFLDLGFEMYDMLQRCQCGCHETSIRHLTYNLKLLQTAYGDGEEWHADCRKTKAMRQKLLEARDLNLANGKEYWSVPSVQSVVVVSSEQKQILLEKREGWRRKDKNGEDVSPSKLLKADGVPMYIAETQWMLYMLRSYGCMNPDIQSRSCCTWAFS